MSKRDDLIAIYAGDLKEKCGVTPDMELLTKVTIGLGPAIYNADSSVVSGTQELRARDHPGQLPDPQARAAGRAGAHGRARPRHRDLRAVEPQQASGGGVLPAHQALWPGSRLRLIRSPVDLLARLGRRSSLWNGEKNPGWKAAGIRLESGLPLLYGLLTRGDRTEGRMTGSTERKIATSASARIFPVSAGNGLLLSMHNSCTRHAYDQRVARRRAGMRLPQRTRRSSGS